MIRGSVVESTDFHDDINKSSEHSDAEEIPQTSKDADGVIIDQVHQQYFTQDEVESGPEDEIDNKKDEQVVAPMRINADINVTYGRSHKEEYIEEDVHINDARNGYEVEMLKEEEREEAEEIQPEYEEKADAFLDYDREQMRKGPESIEEPSFKVDTDASEIDDVPDDRDEEYLQTEAEGYAAVAPKSHTSTNASVNRMHYVESPAEEQQQDQQFYGDNVFMRKREEYPPKEEQVGGTAAIEPVQRVEAPVRRMDASANKEIKQIRENEMVDEAEQKPVSELLSIFGGRRTAQNVIILQKSTEKEQKSKAVAAPPVRSDAPMALTTSAEAITRPGKCKHTKLEHSVS
uniref:Uncharacterized protein n=1 Tax=Parascaris equorum TaxID=6256 RepID=A0A914S3T6_PAREQ